ncbi:MAG: hypothetical protein VKS61_15660 [Candidatus Sericytochromatia bacterium]|nr:hypothetical protein [Candidatus Sericytochromatia bacterium]
MTQARRSLRWGRAATAAGLAAVAAATGCSQPPQAAPPTLSAIGTAKGGKGFQAVKQGDHLVCSACGSQLNAEGRHRLGAMLVRTMQHMNTREAFTRPAQPGELQLKTVVNELIGHIGHEKLGFKIPADQQPKPAADPVNQFPVYIADRRGWQDYVAANPYGCCLPDGVPAPDAPY